MLKPVSLLALDDESAALAAAVQQRVAGAYALDDLMQWRRGDGNVEEAIQSIRAQRQRPDSPLRIRDDISTRELVLVVVSASGPARATLIETVSRIRQMYETRRLAAVFTIEILCLMPEVTKSDDYAAAYGLLKALSAADPKPFGEVWLLDAMNGSHVQFGALPDALDAYADAVAGALTFEAELSGALPGSHPRGMPPLFSTFGYAELFFPRELVLRRVEARFTAELIRGVILRRAAAEGSQSLQAKQFIVKGDLTKPFAQSLFTRFQPKTFAGERTRSADELIAAVRSELRQFRDSVHLQILEDLTKESDRASASASALLDRTVDETLDSADFPTAIRFLEALLDPLPDVRPDAGPSPRNLVTEINGATAALDARVGFVPDTAASDAARKRVRELTSLLEDQQLVADALAPVTAAEQLEELRREQRSRLDQLPEVMFAEEGANNAGRNAAREAEAARLASETQAKEQELRELFGERPRAEHALREALETRRSWMWRQVAWAAAIVALIYAAPYAFGLLGANLKGVTWTAIIALTLFAIVAFARYVNEVAPVVREARERVERIRAQIEATDKAKNSAHNDELQFEHDVAQRRSSLSVLRRTRDAAKERLDALRNRMRDLEELAAGYAQPSIAWSGLSVSIIDDGDVDAWYERTTADRKPHVREIPITRSAARHLPLDDVRSRVAAHASTAFGELRELTLARAPSLLGQEAKLAQRMKRFADISAPLLDLRDDDLPAQQAIQRDVTIWCDPSDGPWTAQLQRRFPDAQIKAAPDALRVHVLTRALHFPGYVLGQIDFYRARYEASQSPEFADVPDLVPGDLLLTGPLRAAYEQVLLGRALGVIELREDGTLMSNGSPLGETHLAAAQHLGSAGAAAARERLRDALTPRLAIARDVERDLRRLAETTPLTPLDKGIIGALVKRYALV